MDVDDLVAANIQFKSYKHILASKDIESDSTCTTQHVPVRRRIGEIYFGMDKELERPFGKAVFSVWLFILLFVLLIVT